MSTLNLAKDVGLPVVTPNTGYDHSIGLGMRFYGEINIAMELASPGLEKIERSVAIALMKLISLGDGVVVHIQLNGQTRSPARCFFQEGGKSPRKSIGKILIHIRAIRTLGVEQATGF